MAWAGIPGIGHGALLPHARRLHIPGGERPRWTVPLLPTHRLPRVPLDSCPTAKGFLEHFIRWSTFCEKYQPEHCELAAELVREIAERNRV